MCECIRCQETGSEEGPWYPATDYTPDLERERISHGPDDRLCHPCALNFAREAEYAENAPKSD